MVRGERPPLSQAAPPRRTGGEWNELATSGARGPVRCLTRGCGGGRSRSFAVSPMFSNPTVLKCRVSGRDGFSRGRATSWPNRVADQLTGRGVPGVASKPACRAASAHHREPSAIHKRGSHTQAAAPGSQPARPDQFRPFRSSGVGHKAQTQFVLAGLAPLPMDCKHTSSSSVVRLTPSGFGPGLDKDRIGDRV